MQSKDVGTRLLKDLVMVMCLLELVIRCGKIRAPACLFRMEMGNIARIVRRIKFLLIKNTGNGHSSEARNGEVSR